MLGAGGAADRPPRPPGPVPPAMTAAPRAASISALVALVLAAVWLFWPAALGGGTTYVATHGISMEPGFHTGDLAILRLGRLVLASGTSSRTAAPSLDTIVMHRIVSGDADGFVTQGDNNDWLDEDRAVAGRDPRPPLPPHPPGRDRRSTRSGRRELLVLVVGRPHRLRQCAPAAGPAQVRRVRSSARAPCRPPSRCRPGRSPVRSRWARRRAPSSRWSAAACSLALPSTQTDDPHPATVAQQGQFSYTGAADGRHHVSVGRHRDRRHRLDAAGAAGDACPSRTRVTGAGADRRARHRCGSTSRSPRPTAGAPS